LYSLKVDVFSLGITLFYLFCRKLPIKNSQKKVYERMSDDYPPIVIDLAEKMLEFDPVKRISIYEVYGRIESDPEFG